MSVTNEFRGIGRITRDLELRKIKREGKDDLSALSFTIAINRSRDRDTADFIDCSVVGKQAEIIANHFHKGSRIGVSGELHARTYTDKNDVTRTAFEVQVDDFAFIDTKSDNAGSNAKTATKTAKSAPQVEEDAGETPW